MSASRILAKLRLRAEPAGYGHARLWPERVVFLPVPGVAPSPKAPVRIFLGTEAAHYRAEHVFAWSVERTRDPSRTYEIYLMKDLAGFDRRRWTTGFTNYRFAVPHFANAEGRVIYNDVDQIYLADPAELFDADMGEHGFLAISDAESSVMLIDCARMAEIWTLDLAQRLSRRRLLARAAAVPGLRGPLSPDWNARDHEYQPGRSKLLHFTTLHTQPWRPFPGQFAYQEHPFAGLWFSLERSADAASFHLFTNGRPSRAYEQLVAAYQPARRRAGWLSAEREARELHRDALARLITRSGARTLLVYGPGAGLWKGDDALEALLGGRVADELHVTVRDPLGPPPEAPGQGPVDGVVCLDWLDHVPEADLPWVLDDLFGSARLFVYAAVNGTHRQLGSCERWEGRFEETAKRHPGRYWELGVAQRSRLAGLTVTWRRGGRLPGAAEPTAWVLTDERPGNNTQSIGLAEALAWPSVVKPVRFNALSRRWASRLLGASCLSVRAESRPAIVPPWPDVVIATGRRLAPVARWIREQSQGQTRLVHLGRKGGHVPELFDLVVTCAHFGLPPHPRRLEVVAPLNRVTGERLTQAAERWPNLFGHAPRPHIALLVGGSSPVCRLDVETARRLGEEVRAFAEAARGTVHALTSRRTGRPATEALKQGLGDANVVHPWRPDQRDNPYLGYLATADVVVVTGESESMLAEAAASGKPVYIYALPERRHPVVGWLRERLVARANARPANTRGTVRPQQGLEYLCARMISRGIVLPPRNIRGLHQTLFRLGVASPFGTALATGSRPAFSETERVARRVRALMGVQDEEPMPATTKTAELATTSNPTAP